MKTLFFGALTFAMMLGIMGVFFGYVIFAAGTEIRDINTDFLFILGTILISGVGCILIATPITKPRFWDNIKEQEEIIKQLYEEKSRLKELRRKYEAALVGSIQWFKRKDPAIGTGIPEGGSDH